MLFALSRSQTGIRSGKLTSNPLLSGNSTVEFGVVQYLSPGCEQGFRVLWIGASCLPALPALQGCKWWEHTWEGSRTRT